MLINAYDFIPRILNLELMADNGSNAWKQYNTILVQMMENAQKHLQDLRYANLLKFQDHSVDKWDAD